MPINFHFIPVMKEIITSRLFSVLEEDEILVFAIKSVIRRLKMKALPCFVLSFKAFEKIMRQAKAFKSSCPS